MCKTKKTINNTQNENKQHGNTKQQKKTIKTSNT